MFLKFLEKDDTLFLVLMIRPFVCGVPCQITLVNGGWDGQSSQDLKFTVMTLIPSLCCQLESTCCSVEQRKKQFVCLAPRKRSSSRFKMFRALRLPKVVACEFFFFDLFFPLTHFFLFQVGPLVLLEPLFHLWVFQTSH